MSEEDGGRGDDSIRSSSPRRGSVGQIEADPALSGSLKWEKDVAARSEYPKWILTLDQGPIENGRDWEGNREGILRKRGTGFFHKKKERYFMFRNQYLCVFKKKPEDPMALPHAAYNVERLEGSPVDGNKITLLFPGGIEHVLFGQSEKDIYAWGNAIEARKKWLWTRRKKRRERMLMQKKNVQRLLGGMKGLVRIRKGAMQRLKDARSNIKAKNDMLDLAKKRAEEARLRREAQEKQERKRRLRLAKERALALGKQKVDEMEMERLKREQLERERLAELERSKDLARQTAMLKKLEEAKIRKARARANVSKFAIASKLAARKPWARSLARARSNVKAKKDAEARKRAERVKKMRATADDLMEHWGQERLRLIQEIRRDEAEWVSLVDMSDFDAADELQCLIQQKKRNLSRVTEKLRGLNAVP